MMEVDARSRRYPVAGELAIVVVYVDWIEDLLGKCRK